MVQLIKAMEKIFIIDAVDPNSLATIIITILARKTFHQNSNIMLWLLQHAPTR